jgi:hypothetical protein
VAPLYAGTLGLLAFLSCLGRGLLQSSSPASTLGTACLSMGAFAAIGLVLGHLAGRTVEESVKQRVAAELAAEDETAVGQQQRKGSR